MIDDGTSTLASPLDRCAFLDGGGEAARMIRERDWSSHALGAPETWPEGLRVALGIVLNSPESMILAWGPDLTFFFNDTYFPLLGPRLSWAMGAPFREVWADAWDQAKPIIDEAFAGRSTRYVDLPWKLAGDRGAEDTWWSFSYSRVLDGKGAVAGLFIVTKETTDRVLGHAAENRNRQILDSAVDHAIMATDLEGRVTRWNEGARRVLGWTEDEMLGRTVEPFFTPEDVASGRPALAMRMALEVGRGNDVRWHRRKSGELFWANGETTPLRDAEGHVIGFVKVLRDLTEQRLAEEALRVSEAQLRRAQQAGGIGIFAVEHDGVLRATTEFFRLYGIEERAGIVSSEFERLVMPEDSARVGNLASRAAGEAPLDVEYRIRRADTGELRWIARKGEIERDAEGRFLRFVGVAWDITVRRQAEAMQSTQLAVTDAIRDLDDPAEIAHAASAVLGTALGVSRAGYGTIDTDTETILIERDWNAPGIPSIAGTLRFRDHGSYIEDLKRGETAVVADARIDPRTRAEAPVLEAIAARAFVNMPLVEQGRFVALLFVNHAEARHWTEEEIALMREVGQRVRAASERVRSEKARRDSEELFRVFAQAVPNQIWAARPDGYLDWFNGQVHAYCGVPEGALHGLRAWGDLVHPADLPEAVKRWGQSLASGQVYETEFRLRRHDGEYLWFIVRAEPVRSAEGAITRWVGTNTDIDDAKRRSVLLEDMVRERTRELDRVWRSTNDLMATAGLDGYLKQVNPAWTRMLGRSEADLLAKPFLDIVDPADHIATGSVVGELSAGRPVRDFVDHVLRMDGSARTIQWNAVPDGDLFHIVGRDITEQRLAEEQLRQSQKMEAVGQLTGGIAHDFNNLLTGITGSLELLTTRIAQGRIGDVERYVTAAQGAAKRAAALTHRLLAFSRRQTLDPKPTDVNRLVHDMAELIRRTVGPSAVIETVGMVGLWPILVDPGQLENSLLNLCINARDAMPDGGRITIETANRWVDRSAASTHDLPPGQYISMCVSDTGTGMAPDIVARAFDPFFTTKPIGQGTGLGLSMIYGFARQSGGHVRIYSEVGRGTMVCIYLPRHLGEVETADGLPISADSPRSAGQGETVLVVDDEPSVRMLVTETLEELGYAAIEAADGPSGLKVLQSDTRIDLLVSDVGLPVREVWADAWDQAKPIIDEAFAGRSTRYVDLPWKLAGDRGAEDTWWSFSYSRVLDGKGAVAGLFIVTKETTDRVLGHAAENRNRQILDSAVDHAIMATDLEGRVTRWNEGARRVLGWTEDEMLGRTVEPFFTPEDVASGRPALAMRMALEVGRGNDVRWHRRKSGELFWANGETTPLRDAEGHVIGFVKVLRDLTEQRLAEEALRVSEAQLRRAQQAGGIGIFAVEHDGVLRATTEFFRLYGIEERAGIVSSEFERLVMPEDSARVGNLASRAAGEAPLDVEYRIRRADTGELRWIARKGEIERDAEGRFLRFVGVAWDITVRRQAEAMQSTQLAVTDAIRDLDDPAEIAHAASAVLGTALGVSRAGYGTIDTDTETILIERDWNAPGIPSIAGTLRFRDHGSYIEDLKRGETAVVADARIDPRTRAEAPVLEAIAARAFVNMPLVEQGRFVALLFVNHAEARHWTEEEIALMREVGQRVRAASERVRSEKARRDSEELFRVFAQAVPNQIWAARPDGYLDWFNGQVHAYCGVPEGALHGLRAWGDLVHPADLPEAVKRWGQSLASGQVYETEFRLRRHDGEYLWFIVRAEPVRSAEGAITRWVGTNTDIDDAKRRSVLLEDMVRERTRELDRVWRSTNDLMATAGLDGYLKQVNPAWTRMLGRSEADLLAKPFLDIVDPADHIATGSVVGELSAGRPVRDFVDHVLRMDGSARTIQWNAVPDGDLFHIVGRDITEQRLAEEQLRQSQKMEAVGQLTGGIAHDFNNLLTGITGSLELLTTRIAQGRIGDVERYVTAAQGAAKRAAALTHRLLAFSRRQTLDPKPTDVNRLVHDMAELIRRTVGPSAVIETVGMVGLWPILVDPGQLENSLLNLCINARDAMPDGGRITIETANRWVDRSAASTHDLPPGQYISMCVSDTGTGMAPDIVARAFDPFFTTKPIGQGTGLGLSMIYGFARQSGGHVRIYSEVGRGTMVCIYLPRHLGEVETADGLPISADSPRSAGQGETVLVVDDEPSVRMLVTETLEELGYAAIEAADGPSGLKVLQSDTRIDLLVSDVGLPGGMNGRQMFDAARVKRPDLKVLFITGYAENAVVGNGHLEAGMHVMTKPFALEALASRIKELIAD